MSDSGRRIKIRPMTLLERIEFLGRRSRREFTNELRAQTVDLEKIRKDQEAELAEFRQEFRAAKADEQRLERDRLILDRQLKHLERELDRTKQERLQSRATWEPHDWRDFD